MSPEEYLTVLRQLLYTEMLYAADPDHAARIESLSWAIQQLTRKEMVQRSATPQVPDYMEPIVAWRAWSVYPSTLLEPKRWPLQLRSWNGKPWEPKKQFVAKCHYGTKLVCVNCGFAEHVAPMKDCTCGVYCFDTFPNMVKYGETYGTNSSAAYGQVYIWGRIIKHQMGYRAQYAYPKAVFSRFDKLAETYGIEVQPLSELDDLARSFGASCFADLKEVLK